MFDNEINLITGWLEPLCLSKKLEFEEIAENIRKND